MDVYLFLKQSYGKLDLFDYITWKGKYNKKNFQRKTVSFNQAYWNTFSSTLSGQQTLGGSSHMPMNQTGRLSGIVAHFIPSYLQKKECLSGKTIVSTTGKQNSFLSLTKRWWKKYN